jgi:hypothetical protein
MAETWVMYRIWVTELGHFYHNNNKSLPVTVLQ